MNIIMPRPKGRYLVPCLITFILTSLVMATIVGFFYERGRNDGDMMLQHLELLENSLMRIHRESKIMSFDTQQNTINFLNIETFSGSEVGPMNLAHPGKWQGPYVKDNPTMQGKEYLVVHASKGYFITPGVGVKLPNGKTVGTDIMLGEDADIAAVAQDPDGLMYGGRPLAVQLNI